VLVENREREGQTPMAAPWMAAMVGFRHLWMARETRPPLYQSY
jgi:hypothetical protein